MYFFISIMLCGAVIGYFVRDRKSVQKTGTVIQVVVCALLYMLGLSIGSNRFLIDHLSYFCGQAAFIAFMSLTGSLLASWLVFHTFFRKEKNS